MTDDNELTLKGFLDLHEMTANDQDGGEGELWDILSAMGYNKQLQLDQVTILQCIATVKYPIFDGNYVL